MSAILFTLFVYIFLLGFGGKRCQEKIDLCASAGCVNGACVDKLFRYECVCQPGWTGDMCDVGIDDCQDNPCSNGNLFNYKFMIYYNYIILIIVMIINYNFPRNFFIYSFMFCF